MLYVCCLHNFSAIPGTLVFKGTLTAMRDEPLRPNEVPKVRAKSQTLPLSKQCSCACEEGWEEGGRKLRFERETMITTKHIEGQWKGLHGSLQTGEIGEAGKKG